MSLDTITFVDLVALTRITPESTVEKFGGLINSSFFDASNILGTLKQRGLIDFVTSFPSQSAITVTDTGKKLIAETQEKAAEPFDTLDMAILIQLSNGKRKLVDIISGVNVTPRDLALHLYKLTQQQFSAYELRNGEMNITLTEKGFLRVKEGIPVPGQESQAQPVQESPALQIDNENIDATSQLSKTPEQKAPQTEEQLLALDKKISQAQKAKTVLTVVTILIAIIIVVYALYAIHII